MAINKKGFRKIVVADKPFYWKFNEKIIVVGGKSENGILRVDFGWYDIWLYVNDQKNEPEPYEPKVVTPDFVKRCIVFALSKDWNPDQNATPFDIYYKKEEFTIEKINA